MASTNALSSASFVCSPGKVLPLLLFVSRENIGSVSFGFWNSFESCFYMDCVVQPSLWLRGLRDFKNGTGFKVLAFSLLEAFCFGQFEEF